MSCRFVEKEKKNLVEYNGYVLKSQEETTNKNKNFGIFCYWVL
jgi:hypothetical protein